MEYANAPERNEFYSYDNRGNIQEKHIGAKTYTYSYDASNQLKSMASEDGVREYVYDEAGRLVEEKLNGETDVEYKYGYLDKVTEVIRKGKSVKYAYDGFGMLTEKRFEDGTIEKWVWDGIALVRRGSDIYVNEPHVSGGVPILTKTAEGVRYHEHDFLGTTLWSSDLKGNITENYSSTTAFGEGALSYSHATRFTGKPYDEDLHAYVFPYRNYMASVGRWMSFDPSGYPDGSNSHMYACVPNISLDILGLEIQWYVCQRPVGSLFGAEFNHTWIQGVDTETKKNYTYSGLTDQGTSSGSVNPDGSGGYLNLYYNNRTDLNANAVGTENSMRITLPNGVTGEKAAQILNSYYKNFSQNTYPYAADAMFGTYNCNSVLTSMLQALGLTNEQISNIFDQLPGYHWGWDTPIPSEK